MLPYCTVEIWRCSLFRRDCDGKPAPCSTAVQLRVKNNKREKENHRQSAPFFEFEWDQLLDQFGDN